ncbi:hypothetical protein SAMN05216522_10516 [Rosenbergiella nectarea]|uniref:Uncharacterized protein n=1 Tax=Rosenbergiella nectarea TaxID=988801 RepID=A0A1H9HQF1_9GAMM|nr:hypothetical protein [Rosenbergiella nectarea]SEQ64570.1 hypothetical protein SAMN05216522_10516 [Rosenbergiella nectarea]
MAMQFIEFQAGERNYSAAAMDAFTIALMWPKIIKKFGKGVGQQTDIAEVISALDEQALKDIIFPMLQKSVVTCTTESKKLSSQSDFNSLFSHENLFEFYQVVWEVVKINFGPLLNGLLAQFGLSLSDLQQKMTQKVDELKEKNQKASSATT